MASSEQSPHFNPAEISTLNPREFYPDGLMESWLNPIVARSWKPAGSAFQPNSDYRKTVTDANRPGAKDRHRQGSGFAADLTGNPWGSIDPGWTMETGPEGPNGPYSPLATHESHPENAADVRTHSAVLAENQQQAQSVAAGLGSNKIVSTLQGFWQASPVAALFFGLAGVFVINSLFLKSRTINRTTRNVGNVAAAPGAGAQAVGNTAMDEVNDAVKDAVTAVDDITPGQ